MTTRHFKKLAIRLTVAFALLSYALVHAKLANERRAADAFRTFTSQLNQKGRPPERQSIEQAVSSSPGNAYYLACQGLFLVRAGAGRFDAASFLSKSYAVSEGEAERLREAARYYERALALNPLDDGNYHNLGWLYAYLGEKEQALLNFRKAVSLDNSIALYHISLGLLHEQGGENEDAYREYELAVRLSPAVLDSHFFRDLRERSPATADRVVAGCISHLEEQLGRDRGTNLKAKLGKLYLHVNLLDKAAALLKEVVSEQPNLSRPWHNLGLIYEMQGDEWAMRNAFQKAVFLDGEDAVAWFRLADMQDRRHNSQAALNSYLRALKGWVNTRSEHAARAARTYRTQSFVLDDVVPNGFLSYCKPYLDLTDLCQRIARLYEESGDSRAAKYYSGLGTELAP